MHSSDVKELLNIAKKINRGEYNIDHIAISEESGLYEIAKYFLDATKTLKEITKVVDKQAEKLPIFDATLNEVRKLNKDTANNILAYVDKLNLNLDAIKEYISILQKGLQKNDKNGVLVSLEKFRDLIIEEQGICFDLITFLEFQDVIKNRLNKLGDIIKEVEEMLTNVMVKLGIKEGELNLEKIEMTEKEKPMVQDVVDQLLKEFGL